MSNPIFPGQGSRVQVRAVVTSRLSRVHKHATGDESQLLNAHEYATARRWAVVGEASDLDVSAIKIRPWDRPELGHWLRNPHLYDALIFRSIDRLARKMTDFFDLMSWADKHRIRLVCLELGEGVDFSTPEGKFVAMGLAYAAEVEGKKITDRALGSRKHMRPQGRWASGKTPYGMRTCPHPSGKGYALELEPETADVARRIVGLFMGEDENGRPTGEPGMSRNGIADLLNAEGIPAPLTMRLTEEGRAKRAEKGRTDPRWSSQAITRILSNPTLMRGFVTYAPPDENGKRSLAARRVVRHTEGDRAGQPVTYTDKPLMTDVVQWARLQRLLEETSTSGDYDRPPTRSHEDAYQLLGVAFCGICKHRMYGSWVPIKKRIPVLDAAGNHVVNERGRLAYEIERDDAGNVVKDKRGLPKFARIEVRTRVYRCVSKRAKGADCPGHSITGDDLEAWTIDRFLSRVGHLSTVVTTVDPGENHAVELDDVEAALTELRGDRKAGLYRGERGDQEFRTMYTELEERREQLSSRPYRPPTVTTVETGILYAHEWQVSSRG
ncbi:MAG: recombinase family protein, partial [Umezawaea sp.]